MYSSSNRILVWLGLLLMALGTTGCCDDPKNGTGDPPLTDQVQWVFGSVLGADAAPIAGAQVRLTSAVTTTDAAGRFGFETRAGAVHRAVEASAVGYLPVERLLPAGGGARIELAPIFLLAADAEVVIEGRAGGRLFAEEAGIEVIVPRKAFEGSVTLRVARMPLGDPLRDELLLPAPIPTPADGSPMAALFAILIDAGGAQPSTELTVNVTTGAALPSGTRVPVGRFDETSGAWVDIDEAIATGGRLSFITGHLSTFAAALPALPADGTVAPDLGTLSRAVSPFRPGEPRIDPRSGAVQVGFSLPPIWRRAERHQLSLFYDSRTVKPVVAVPVVARDASQGEELDARVMTDLGHKSVSFTVTESPLEDASPGVVLDVEQAPLPETTAAAETPSGMEPSEEVETGSYTATVQIFREAPGVLNHSATGRFTDPVAGERIEGQDGEPVPTPEPLQLRRSDQIAVAVDNRNESPFGRGWQVGGLTRLIQPWCTADRVTLAGERDYPAVTFGVSSEPVLRSLAQELIAAGKTREELGYSQVAVSGGNLYVAITQVGEVWRLHSGGTDPVLFAGGGPGTALPGQGEAADLRLDRLTAISAGPRGQGILVATTHFISHILPDGTATRVAGTGNTSCDADDVRVGESPLESTFCDWLSPSIAADPTSDRFIFGLLGQGSYEVVDGKLNSLRTREGSPHWHNLAFDAKGTLYYSSDTGQCIYRHIDGLTDPELFPRCLRSGEDPLEDGPAETAMAGNARAMDVDSNGALWFVDGQYGVLRRYVIGGEVLTMSDLPAEGNHNPVTVPGSLLGGAVLGYVDSLIAIDPLHLYMGGVEADDLCTTAPLEAGTLTAMGSGDGSLLVPLEDESGWVRVLESGWVEHYDERGLLESRGQPGEPPLEYVYAGDWPDDARDAEICGRPTAPPPLHRIDLGGDALWTFEYRDGRLVRITDAAGGTVVHGSTDDSDSFDLPGGARVIARYDDDGRLLEKSAPGPSGADRWLFSWSEGRVSALIDPTGREEEVVAAEASVAVGRDSFDAAGIADDAEAAIPSADLPVKGGERSKVVLGDFGVTLTSPDGEETRLDTDPFGRLMRVTQPDGTSLRLSRDPVGRIVGITNENLSETWRYRYGRVVSSTGQPYLDERLLERTDPEGLRTVWRYDGTGALVERTDPAGTTRLQPASGGAARGLPTRIVDGAGRRIDMTYDSFGNSTRIAVVDPSDPARSMVTLIERDAAGRPRQVTEPTGLVVRSVYEPWGEVTRHTVGDEAAGHTLTIERTSTAAWTEVGDAVPPAPMTLVRDGEGREWRFVFGPGWRLNESRTPSAGLERFSYDPRGRLIERALADGSTEALSLDESGRVAERRWFGPAAGARVGFAFDERGRVAEMDDPLLIELREYQPGLGWSRLIVTPTSPDRIESAFTLDRRRLGVGRESQTMDSSRVAFRRGFDGRVEQVAFGTQGEAQVLTFERDGARRLTGVPRGNGTHSEFVYDALGRVIAQTETTPSGATEITYEWEGDRPVSRIMNGVTRIFEWDDQGRLAGCGDTGESYGYDRSGSRVGIGGAEILRDTAGRMTSDGEYSYTYDLLGRRIGRVSVADPNDGSVYEYGPAGRLSRVLVGPAGSETELASYAYDGAGRRIERTTAAGTWLTGYLPDSDRPVRVREPDGTIWHLVHALPTAAWSAAFANDGRERYVHLDPFDKVFGVSDEEGNLVRLEDDCFGAPLSSFAPGGPPVGMHGMAFDAETGLFLAGARYYDPTAGEFLSPDPRGIEGGAATYGYGDGNPILAQDPGGRLFFVALGALAVGGLVFNEIRKVAQSDDVRRARRGYEAMTDVASKEDALAASEDAHKDLTKASIKGGEAAVKSTVSAGQAVTNPAENLKDLAGVAQELGESLMEEGSSGEPPLDE